jgi:hypothetical protein
MKINIVSFNIPYPANYGGAIDVYYKLKALHELGVGIILHCFVYDREPNDHLEKYCDEVFYYTRNTSIGKQFNLNPYIVASRKNIELKKNLLKNAFPILFEGIHTTAFLGDHELAGRLKLVRMHNIDSAYYSQLSKTGKNIATRLYFILEAYKLKKYEKKLVAATHILAISKLDFYKLKDDFESKVIQVNAFHAFDGKLTKDGNGKYVLYHGDLSISDNQEGVYKIIEHYNSDLLKLPLVIAGYNPPYKLVTKINSLEGITLIQNPSDKKMEGLIANAHINIIFSSNNSGIKLKLIHSLQLGRYCVVNEKIVAGTVFKECCTVFNGSEPESLNTIMQPLIQKEYKKNDHKIRYELLLNHYSNHENAKKIIQLIKKGT